MTKIKTGLLKALDFLAARSRERSTVLAVVTLIVGLTGWAIDAEHVATVAGLVGGLAVIVLHPDATVGE
jgi:hypothetical protein